MSVAREMPDDEDPPSVTEGEGVNFPLTEWDLVAAARGDERAAEVARETLCRMYWEPLRCFARAQGMQEADAKDAVQGFLADFLGKRGGFGSAEEERGRMRTYLLRCFSNHLKGQGRRDRAVKRGGGGAELPYEEGRHAPVDRESPQQLYDRRWSLMILNEAMRALEESYGKEGREEVFRQLWPLLTERRAESGARRAAAQVLGLADGTVAALLSRMRKRFRQVLMETVRATMGGASEEEVLAEMKLLREAAQ